MEITCMTEKVTHYTIHNNVYLLPPLYTPLMIDGVVFPYGADIPYQPGKKSASIIDLEKYRSKTSGKPVKS